MPAGAGITSSGVFVPPGKNEVSGSRVETGRSEQTIVSQEFVLFVRTDFNFEGILRAHRAVVILSKSKDLGF